MSKYRVEARIIIKKTIEVEASCQDDAYEVFEDSIDFPYDDVEYDQIINITEEKLEGPVIEEIGKLQYANIIEYGHPLGRYYLELEPGMYLGIDNMKGMPNVKAFGSPEDAINWLKVST